MMDKPKTKEELLERYFEIDEEQFERLNKIVVESVESPNYIELTPFRGDGGIDVRGHVGSQLYRGRFGVQSKQHTGNIGSPAMRNFMGALQQHHYQFGAYITTSEFSSGAEEIIRDQDIPITLIDGYSFAEVMIDNGVGVIEEGEGYDLDPSFWEIFEKTTAEDLVPSIEVPQADSLDVLHYALQAIDRGHRFKPEIVDYMVRKTGDDWTKRQADYYPAAAYALGFTHKDTTGDYQGRKMRRWGLTRDGQEYIELLDTGQDDEAAEELAEQIRDMAISKRILPVIQEEGSIDKERLGELVDEHSEIGGTTAPRRARTLFKWYYEALPEIRQTKGNGQILEYIESDLTDF